MVFELISRTIVSDCLNSELSSDVEPFQRVWPNSVYSLIEKLYRTCNYPLIPAVSDVIWNNGNSLENTTKGLVVDRENINS